MTDHSDRDDELKIRTESDSMGEIQVPAERYWGAQTQRSLQNFRIGGERMPDELIKALGIQKLAAARANVALGELDGTLGGAIERAAREVADGLLLDNFPLVVWQTGSGTQSQHEHANEVLAGPGDRASRPESVGSKEPGPPQRPLSICGQSSNDTFPDSQCTSLPHC